MIVSIHQPNYLPYLGFIDKMKKSDVFIIYDDAQFNKEDFQHRNRIRIFQGWKWLTVPVEKKRIPINEIRINNELRWKDMSWNEVHLKEIRENYRDAPYFGLYETEIRRIYTKKYDRLIDINMELIYFLKKAFDISADIVFSGKFGYESKSTEKLIELVEAAGGDTYLSGPAGMNYLDTSL
jgi:hypothetical protein